MFDAFRYDIHLARTDRHCTVAKIDAQLSIQHDERLVRIAVVMPDEVTLDFDDLELVVVHLSNDPRLPVIIEEL